jgi:hypothetical protein
MAAGLADRSISCPRTHQEPTLPPTRGSTSQRAAPRVKVSVSVAGESKITIWPYDAGMFAMD